MTDNNKEKDIVELSADALEEASGGWVYDGGADWLKGFEISCPYCGNSSRDVAKFKVMSPSRLRVIFSCVNCKREFYYSAMTAKKGQIILLDDHEHTLKRWNPNT